MDQQQQAAPQPPGGPSQMFAAYGGMMPGPPRGVPVTPGVVGLGPSMGIQGPPQPMPPPLMGMLNSMMAGGSTAVGSGLVKDTASVSSASNQPTQPQNPSSSSSGVFDASDFPSLVSQGGGLGGSDSRDSLQFGMLRHKHGSVQNGEFSIQNEEFPALGGGNKGGGEGSASSNGNKKSEAPVGFLQPYGQVMGNLPPPPPPKDSGQQPPPPPTIKVLDGNEKFGLLGLLSVIRMSDADLTTLALGTDLTTLGLNLNSPGSLYKSFTSPWSDAQQVPPEPEFKVPSCYLQQATSLLQPGSIKSFPLETLFYMFYSMCAEEGQVLASEELWSRGWCYHREHKLWLARVPNTEPVVKTDRYERGSFLVFDSMAWDIVRKDNFLLSYDLLQNNNRVI
mmetsp:Transcript_6630/g.12118  ORF Transcript_6630/g.12118 Transcript_6630/m.12118 type:complete len:393 (+) Transcript_6630:165-1343(+)